MFKLCRINLVLLARFLIIVSLNKAYFFSLQNTLAVNIIPRMITYKNKNKMHHLLRNYLNLKLKGGYINHGKLFCALFHRSKKLILCF